MSLLARDLEARDERRTQQDEADDQWLREGCGVDPEARRAAWRRWLRRELETALQWPKNAAARDRLIGQCANEITILARQLRGRGWLLDGQALALQVRELLAPIAKAQQAGRIKDFWPYFGEAVSRYVGARAEEIQAHARQTGAEEGAQTMAGALAALGLGKAPTKAPSLTELLTTRDAQVRAEKLAKQSADKAQLKLL